MKLFRFTLPFTIILITLTHSSTDWKLYSTLDSFRDVDDIVSCGNKFFGIFNYSIVSSIDGANWNYVLADSFYPIDLYSDGDQLMVIKSDREILVSDDVGKTFNSYGQLSSGWYSQIFKDIKFIISDSEIYAANINDTNFTKIETTPNLLLCASTKNVFTLSHSGHNDGLLYTTDGYEWNSTTLPIAGIINSTDSLLILSPRNVTFINDIYISINATDWINVRNSPQFGALAGLRKLTKASDGTWVGFTKDDKKVISEDGVNWVDSDFNIGNLSVNLLANNSEMIIVCGALGAYYSADNGKTFNPFLQSDQRDIYSIFSVDEIGLIGTKYSGLTSSDDGGKSWYQIKKDTPRLPGHDIVVGDGNYVSIGTEGYWAQSSNGVDWIIAVEDYLLENHGGSSVSWSGSYFTWIGHSYYPLKLNGDSWDPCTTEALVPIQCHEWGNGTMVGVGSSDSILVGEDIENLEIIKLFNNIKNLNAIHHNGDEFMAVGGEGNIIRSINGRDWEQMTDVPVLEDLYGVYWTGNKWYAIGDNGTLIFSIDGITWYKEDFPENDNLTSIGVYDSKLYVGGRNLYYKEIDVNPINAGKNHLVKQKSIEVSLIGKNIKINSDIKGALNVRVIDLKGREVIKMCNKKNVSGIITMSLENLNLSSNIYILDIRGENINYRKQIVQFR